jgi:hypothetical protein
MDVSHHPSTLHIPYPLTASGLQIPAATRLTPHQSLAVNSSYLSLALTASPISGGRSISISSIGRFCFQIPHFIFIAPTLAFP